MIKIASPVGSRKAEADSDARLMVEAREGNRAAFDELIDRYYDYVASIIAYLMGSPALAPDLTQEVFLRAFRARERYEARCKFSTWLFTIAHNVVANAKQRRGWRPWRTLAEGPDDDNGHDPQLETRGSQPQEGLLRSEANNMLETALAKLTSQQSEAISLYYFGGMEHEAIAKQLNTSRAAVKSMIHRGRQRLRCLLAPYFETGAAVEGAHQ